MYLDDLPDKFDLDSAVWELTLDIHCVIFIHFLLRVIHDSVTFLGVKSFIFYVDTRKYDSI